MSASKSIPAVLAAAFMASSAQLMAPAPAMAQNDAARDLGHDLALQHCARCHAIATDDASEMAEAPAFRTLSRKYPLESLEEALAEGIMTGHSDMPQFQFEPDQITALIAYMRSVQEP